MVLLEGKKLAETIQSELKQTIANFKGRKPTLVVILVGENPASQVYVKKKAETCIAIGIRSVKKDLPSSSSEKELLQEIQRLNQDPEVDGILVQLPLPAHIDPHKVNETIDPSKDVDGFNPVNVGKLLIGQQDGFTPCTPLGIKLLLERSAIAVDGKHVVIVGRSNIVGKPMAAILMQRAKGCNATVTIAHSHTKDLPALCRSADILIAAIGHPGAITSDMVKEGAVVIDVGINRIEDSACRSGYRLVGDVDFTSVKDKCSHITPVPGGVGPLTIAMLLHNTVLSYQRRHSLI